MKAEPLPGPTPAIPRMRYDRWRSPWLKFILPYKYSITHVPTHSFNLFISIQRPGDEVVQLV